MQDKTCKEMPYHVQMTLPPGPLKKFFGLALLTPVVNCGTSEGIKNSPT